MRSERSPAYEAYMHNDTRRYLSYVSIRTGRNIVSAYSLEYLKVDS